MFTYYHGYAAVLVRVWARFSGSWSLLQSTKTKNLIRFPKEAR